MWLLVLAYLGGVLTIVSPCILPVLPFVFARTGQPFIKSGLPLLAGMALTFALVSFGVAALPALWRLVRGPAAQDRVQALDFLYLLGMLVTLVLGIRNGSDMYFEAALIIALTGFVSSSALAKFLLRGEVIE